MYEPAPFASRSIFNVPTLKFSPDGKQILLIRNAGSGEEAWLMPYPTNVAKPPQRDPEIWLHKPGQTVTQEFAGVR